MPSQACAAAEPKVNTAANPAATNASHCKLIQFFSAHRLRPA
jgi:hypothetical protein